MSKIFWMALRVSPAILGAVLGLAHSALSSEATVVGIAPNQIVAATDKPTSSLKQNIHTQEPNTPTLETPLSQQLDVNPISVLKKSVITAEAPVPETALTQLVPTTDQPASALEQINQYTQEPDNLSQVTNVSQLRDVQPGDWAYEALRSLVERYGCIAGYPDGTFRGNRAMTRYEFAAGLNACLTQIEKLIATSTADFATKEDLAKLQRLIDEFGPELATLRTRVDNLEGRTAFLEEHQFSTTTKLNAQVIFSTAGVSSGNRAVSRNFIPSFDPTNNPNTQYQSPNGTPLLKPDGTPLTTADANELYGLGNNFRGRRDSNIIFSHRVRLNFDTSFTGQDRLRLRLEAQNTPEFKDATGTNYGRLAFDGDSGNAVNATVLEYRFPLGKNIVVRVAPQDELYRLIETDVEAVSPLEDDDNGSISKFGRFNPLFRLGGENIRGASLTYTFNPAARLTVVYAGTGGANDPNFGLFNDGYIALGQLTLKPIEPLTLGLTYVRSYSSNLAGDENSAFDREAGSKLATNPFPDINGSAARVNSYGAELAYRFSSRFTLSGWAGYSLAEHLAASGDKAKIWNWAVSLSFPDLGKDGNLLGIVVGQPPKVTSNDYGPNNKRGFPQVVGGSEPDTSYHFEVFYRYQVTDNIAITPGLIVITNPENNKNNDTNYVGVVRTTFSF